MSICVALMAGGLDAMTWQQAGPTAEPAVTDDAAIIDAEVRSQPAALAPDDGDDTDAEAEREAIRARLVTAQENLGCRLPARRVQP